MICEENWYIIVRTWNRMSFREVRKVERQITKTAAAEVLIKGEYGVLSTIGEDGYAYGVPLSYVYRKETIYLHCALEGHKLDNIKFCEKASFCVVGDTEILPEKFSTKYESVIVFGVVKEVELAEREEALLGLVEKYSPNYIEKGKAYIRSGQDKARVIKLCIEHITGKARK